MRRLAISGLTGILLLPVLAIGAAAGLLGGGAGADLGQPVADIESNAGVPPEYLRLFVAAGAGYDVPWTVLAGIGKVECDDGQNPAPACTQEGATNYAGAGGPMQFLASTWQQYGVSVSGGPPDRWNAADAIFTAARYLARRRALARAQRAMDDYEQRTTLPRPRAACASSSPRRATGQTARRRSFAMSSSMPS